MNHPSTRLGSGFTRVSPFLILLGFATIAYGQSQSPPVLPSPTPFTYLSLEDPYPISVFDVQSFSFGSESLNHLLSPSASGTTSIVGTVLGGIDPSVTATATQTVLSNPVYPISGSRAHLDYSLEITGPTSTEVPVQVIALLSNTWSSNIPSTQFEPDTALQGEFGASSVFAIDDSDDQVVDNWAVYNGGEAALEGNGDSSLNLAQTVFLSADEPYNIFIAADSVLGIFAGPIPDGTYSVSASVDPTFAIDPTFALNNPGYSIEYSPNLVPDTPHTLGLLVLSLFGFVVVRLRTLRAGCGS